MLIECQWNSGGESEKKNEKAAVRNRCYSGTDKGSCIQCFYSLVFNVCFYYHCLFKNYGHIFDYLFFMWVVFVCCLFSLAMFLSLMKLLCRNSLSSCNCLFHFLFKLRWLSMWCNLSLVDLARGNSLDIQVSCEFTVQCWLSIVLSIGVFNSFSLVIMKKKSTCSCTITRIIPRFSCNKW